MVTHSLCMSDFHKECRQEISLARARYNEQRFHQLNGLLGNSMSSCWTYLLSVNGGAAAGLLAFIGSKQDLAKLQWPYWALVIFAVGIVFVGLGHAFMTHKLQALIVLWVKNTVRYFANEVTWSYVLKEDEKLVDKLSYIPWILGWSSLASFLLGIGLVAINFRQLAVNV